MKKTSSQYEQLKKEVKGPTTHSFSIYNDISAQGISQALKNCIGTKMKPIIVCVGSDLVLGDSLGPLIGTMLLKKNVPAYVYGTLSYPITAKEVEVAKKYLSTAHPEIPIIAVDAAVGNHDDIGLIRVKNTGLLPGLGVAKKLGAIGDASIIGVVAEKSIQNYNLFNLTRLGMIYKMAEQIADGITQYVKENFEDTSSSDNISGQNRSFFANKFNNVFADVN